MVRFWIGVLFILTIGMACRAAEVESNINQNTGQVNFPLDGTITITHDTKSEIDQKSFKIEGRALETTFVKNVNLPGDTVVTIYSFTLPAQPKGPHVLAPISVKVGKQTYQSAPSSYEVLEKSTSSFIPKSSSSLPPKLKLEAFVQGPKSLYIGERTNLVYRISFNRSIDLTQSELPFIHTTAFLKVGDAQIRDEQQGDMTVQEISQLIEASQMGSFQLGPSIVKGYAYHTNVLGQKEYDSELLQAEAPAITIAVTSFPPDNQPASFNGALGTVKAEISMTTPSSINIGDNIELLIKLGGVTNLAELHLPPLICQPGFSGLFQISDLPPAADIENNQKNFRVILKPLSSLVKEIPSIELSSFDLAAKKYHSVQTNPIPITILAAKAEDKINLPIQKPPGVDVLQAMLDQPLPPVEMRRITPLQSIQIPFLQRGWILFILPLGLLFLYWQNRMQRNWMNRPMPEVKKSGVLLEQAQKLKNQPEAMLKSLEEAVAWYLKESGANRDAANDFILKLHAFQYSSEKSFNTDALLQEAKSIMQKDKGP